MIELCEATEDNPFIHGMSRQFVSALEQLFDVMDTERTGTIRFLDLAAQWQEDDADPFFPKGLIGCLAKVQLANGLLTFDRFCAGIKLCLLKNQVEIKMDGIATSRSEQDQQSRTLTVIQSPQPSGTATTSSERPSSEPQVFAPPPPPPPSTSIHQSPEVNNNIIYGQNSKQTPAPPLSPSSVSSSAMNHSSGDADSSGTLSKSKKLPLPSYEQVMAAKCKIQISTANTTSFKQLPPSKSGNELVQPTSAIDEESSSVNNSNNTTAIKNIPSRSLSSHLQQNHDPKKSFNHLFNMGAPSTYHRTKSLSHLDRMPSSGTATTEINGEKSADLNGGDPRQLPHPKMVTRNCIMKTLQNWRDNILNKHPPNLQIYEPFRGASLNSHQKGATAPTSNLILPHQATEAPMMMMINDQPPPHHNPGESQLSSFNDICSLTSNSLRRSSMRRREPRRHTVGANGIDLYAVKRFQQLEQEKELLIRGLGELEKTKEWYVRQISSIQDKINIAGRCGTFPSDCNIDAYQERINFQAIRIQTLNQHLIALREAGQTFPIHMNLAIRPVNGLVRPDPNQPKQLVVNPNLVNKLKEQNRLLTDEVTRKSERITQLEREKSSLIRELFQARTYSSYYNGHFDDTFM